MLPGKNGGHRTPQSFHGAAKRCLEDQMVTRAELASGVERAFLDYGYQYLTMTALADAIDVTRRTVYNYFRSKEEAFRFLIEEANARAVEAGMADTPASKQ